MRESEIVEVDGVFLGAAIRRSEAGSLSFFATHDRVRALHGAVMPSLAVLRQQAARQFRGVRSARETIAVSGRPDA